MKTKRTKANRRTMQIYNTVFNFREPYQVIVDADFMITVSTQKIDLISRLSTVLGGTVKPMITQCTISHLIKLAKAGNQTAQAALDTSRSLCERRKCNHWSMKDSTIECISGIIGQKENKMRYLIATQDMAFRTYLRERVVGVPLVYVNRSGGLWLEDEGPVTELRRHELEKQKLHIPEEELEILRSASAPKTEIISNPSLETLKPTIKSTERLAKKLNKSHKKKEPNPLSIKKKQPKKIVSSLTESLRNKMKHSKDMEEESVKKKRKRSGSKKSKRLESSAGSG